MISENAAVKVLPFLNFLFNGWNFFNPYFSLVHHFMRLIFELAIMLTLVPKRNASFFILNNSKSI